MERYPKLTEEQLESIRSNPHTAAVTNNKIYYTLDFKKTMLRRSNAGDKPKQIFTDAGYDTKMLGSARTTAAITNVKREVASHKGLRACAAERNAQKLREKNRTNDELLKRVAQLERELELLKKSYQLKMKYLKQDN